ncbi:unnamed protein product [Cuscuta campestris]|uniref:Retrotransposon gag domain-containing protein n=1 Tax=Cuscuta campestris TaxID=132261 RepID=A0A484LTA7_9ASTE|nr:unnamed protein product [Cuscuta campestris]
MEGGSETTNVTKGGEKKTKTQRSRSRETMDGFETRLARVELAIADGEEKFEEMGQGMDEFREEMQAAMNKVLAQCLERIKAMEEFHKVEVSSIQVELEKVSRKLESAEEELVLCKKALAQGSPSTSEVRTPPSKLDIPRPKSYKGSRNAKELDNFLWSMEKYFRALAISEEKRKVDMASLFLEDTAMVWWRRRQGDMEKGTCTIDTWAEFKSELKKQFYPSNVEEEARGKLRRLQHKGSIREYVKEFTEVLLEIPDYPNKEAFFAFMDGLQQWARLELQRRGAQDLTTAISIAESLIEFKKHFDGDPRGSPELPLGPSNCFAWTKIIIGACWSSPEKPIARLLLTSRIVVGNNGAMPRPALVSLVSDLRTNEEEKGLAAILIEGDARSVGIHSNRTVEVAKLFPLLFQLGGRLGFQWAREIRFTPCQLSIQVANSPSGLTSAIHLLSIHSPLLVLLQRERIKSEGEELLCDANRPKEREKGDFEDDGGGADTKS